MPELKKRLRPITLQDLTVEKLFQFSDFTITDKISKSKTSKINLEDTHSLFLKYTAEKLFQFFDFFSIKKKISKSKNSNHKFEDTYSLVLKDIEGNKEKFIELVESSMKDFYRSSFHINGDEIVIQSTKALLDGYKEARNLNTSPGEILPEGDLDELEKCDFKVVEDPLRVNAATKVSELNNPISFEVAPSLLDELIVSNNVDEALYRRLGKELYHRAKHEEAVLVKEGESASEKSKLDYNFLQRAFNYFFQKKGSNDSNIPSDEYEKSKLDYNFLQGAFKYFFKKKGSNESNIPSDALLKILALHMHQNSFVFYPAKLLYYLEDGNSERSYTIDSRSSNQVTISISYPHKLIYDPGMYAYFKKNYGLDFDKLDTIAYKEEGPFSDIKLIIVIKDDGKGSLSYKEIKFEVSVYNKEFGIMKSYDLKNCKEGEYQEFSCKEGEYQGFSRSIFHSASNFLTNTVSVPQRMIGLASQGMHRCYDLLTHGNGGEVSESSRANITCGNGGEVESTFGANITCGNGGEVSESTFGANITHGDGGEVSESTFRANSLSSFLTNVVLEPVRSVFSKLF